MKNMSKRKKYMYMYSWNGNLFHFTDIEFQIEISCLILEIFKKNYITPMLIN